jgi:hypothetical protein
MADYQFPTEGAAAEEIQHWVTFKSYESTHNLGGDHEVPAGTLQGTAKVMCPQNLIEANSHRYGTISQKLLGGAAEAIQAGGGVFETIGEAGFAAMQSLIEGAGVPLAQQINSVLTRTVTNPREEQYYQAPNFRSFNFAWEFAPTSKDDSEKLGEMIRWFTRQSYPIEDATGSNIRIKMPNEWRIEHVIKDGGRWEGVSQYSKCVLVSLNTNYTGAGMVQSFDGGGPAFVNLELNFTESTLRHQGSKALE